MDLKVDIEGSIEKEVTRARATMGRAITRGMKDCAVDAQHGAQAAVSAAGFHNIPVETKIYPKGKETMKPTVVVFSPTRYAKVFAEGALVKGQPYLWLPLRTAPRGMQPSEYVQKVGPLYTIRREGKPPMLGARLPSGRLTPVYVGVRQVLIPKKFDFKRPVEDAFKKVQQRVDQNLVTTSG